MAFNNSKLSMLAVAMMLSLALLLVITGNVADASNLDVWSGPGCNNRAERYIQCGCSEIRLNGGYEFSFNGPPATMYMQSGCRGASVARFNGNARNCNPFPWKSMFIQC